MMQAIDLVSLPVALRGHYRAGVYFRSLTQRATPGAFSFGSAFVAVIPDEMRKSVQRKGT
jgi:hypothetical protein